MNKVQYTSIVISLLLLCTSLGFAFEYSINYDSNGNLIDDGEYTYSYNNFNQLKAASKNGELIAEYWYDENGKRIKKEENGKITYYPDENYVREIQDNLKQDTIYYYDSQSLVGKKDSSGKYFYHPNHMGSTELVTDESGNLIEETKYLPYGTITEGGESRFLFTGKEYDSGSNLYQYGKRYYSPELRRFTQPDTLLADVYDPQQLNRYAYALNNPITYDDSQGNSPTIITGLIGAGTGAIIGATVSFGVQMWQSGGDISQVSLSDMGKAAVIGGISGGVAGLTLGLGSTAIGAIGLTGKTAMVAEGALAATSSIAAGQSSRATANIMEGNAIAQGLGNPKDIAVDGVIGLATFGAVKTYSFSNSKMGTTLTNPRSLSRSQPSFQENIGYIKGLRNEMLKQNKYVGPPIRYIKSGGKIIVIDGHHHMRAAVASSQSVPIKPASTGYYGYYSDIGKLRTFQEAVTDSSLYGR